MRCLDTYKNVCGRNEYYYKKGKPALRKKAITYMGNITA
jgi:hypothetical protein